MSETRGRSASSPLRCWRVLRVVQAYLDGETDETTARRVAEHLEDCTRCGLEADTFRAIKRVIAGHERPSTDTVRQLRQFWEHLLESPDTPAS